MSVHVGCIVDEPRAAVLKSLRVFVLLLLGAICYQVGYRSGYGDGKWNEGRRQMHETADALNDRPVFLDAEQSHDWQSLAQSTEDAADGERTPTADARAIDPDDLPAPLAAKVIFNSDEDAPTTHN
jgi:hypothetical protein